MATFSFLLRRGVWIAAAILLISTFFVENGVLTFVLFILVVCSALGYSWLDNEAFGELLSNFAILSTKKETRVYDNTRTHQAYQDTYYHKDSPRDLVRLLEDLRHKYTHVRIHYGDPVTGLEDRDMAGYVNCSSGAVQIPLLSQHGQQGGAPLLDHSIVQIVDLERDFILYQHPTYHQAESEEVSDEVDVTDEMDDDLEHAFVFFQGPVHHQA